MSRRGSSAGSGGGQEEGAGQVVAGEAGAGPGMQFMPFVVMEDLLDKLKLLNYELEFVAELRMRPLNRHYFVIQVEKNFNNKGRFHLLSSYFWWIILRSFKMA